MRSVMQDLPEYGQKVHMLRSVCMEKLRPKHLVERKRAVVEIPLGLFLADWRLPTTQRQGKSMNSASQLLIGLALGVICACTTNDTIEPDTVEQPSFSFLGISGHSISTANGIPLSVTVPDGFRILGPVDRNAEFGNHPFEVSLAAFVAGDTAVLVHAERVADGSGASDYSDLPQADWPDAGFHQRDQCIVLSQEDVAADHDPSWLRDQDWDPVGPLAFEQYLTTTPDHNREVIISLAVRGVDCGDAAAVEAALDALRFKVQVKRL